MIESFISEAKAESVYNGFRIDSREAYNGEIWYRAREKRPSNEFCCDLSQHDWRGITAYWLTVGSNMGRIKFCWDGKVIAIVRNKNLYYFVGREVDLVEARLREII